MAAADNEWVTEQLKKFEFDFDEADKDKSGNLSKTEILNVLRTSGFAGTDEEADKLFANVDKGEDGSISKNEYLNAMKGMPKLSMKEFVLRKAFKQLDSDSSGKLTRAEIMDATKADVGGVVAKIMDADKVADLLIELSKDVEDEKIDYEEFLRFYGMKATASVVGQIFTKMDTDNTGYLSYKEIMEGGTDSEISQMVSAEKLSNLLIGYCKDDDGKISYEEFSNLWLAKAKEGKK